MLTSQCRWARVRDTQAGALGTWPSGSGRKRREARSSVHSSGGRSSFVSARRQAQRQAATESRRPIPIRTGFYTRTATLPFSPLPSSPSLPFPSSQSQSHPRRPSPNPSGIRTCLRRRRGAVLGVGRRGGPAVSDPGPAPLGRVIRGNSRELKGAPFALVGGSKWGISVPSGLVAPDELWVLIGANFSSVILVICTLCI